MKNNKLKFFLMFILVLFTLTGCGGGIDQETSDFIDACNAKPGCKYKVLSGECVCDKTKDYIPRP